MKKKYSKDDFSSQLTFMKVLVIALLLSVQFAAGQRIIFSDNFERQIIDSSWQIVSGDWSVGDVQEFRIAPAEKGYRYMLYSGSKNYTGDNIIRIAVDLPDSLKAKKIKLSFSYYILANASGAKIEVEFYQKEMKDGTRGPLWVDLLRRVKGRWSPYQKTLTIPPRANLIYITFFGFNSSGKKDMIICFDNIIVSALK
jgi:hypothetical protein